MVLYVLKWDIPPETREQYARWLGSAIQRSVAVPGVIEYRAYGTVAGPSRKVATYEFADLAAWQAWYSHPEIERLLGEWELLWEPYTERATCLESGAATDMTDYGNERRRAFRQPVRAPANSDSSSQRP